MAKAEIEINIRNGEEQFGALRFQPDEAIEGTVTILPDSDVNCKHLYVRLEWHTEGRGSQFRQKVEELDLFQGDLQGLMPRTFDFSFRLPDEPWSYEGHYISIVWAIAVQIDVPWGRDVKYEEPFLLSPQREADSASNRW